MTVHKLLDFLEPETYISIEDSDKILFKTDFAESCIDKEIIDKNILPGGIVHMSNELMVQVR